MSEIDVVTGGTGFIGSNLAAALAVRGDRAIVVADWLGRGEKWRNLAKHPIERIVAPERLFEFLDTNAASIGRLFHMGAISSTTETDADLIYRTNVELPQRLWIWCSAHDVPFLYASSAATYGDGRDGFVDREDAASLARLRPRNAYGWSKNVFDWWVARRLEEDGGAPPQWAGLKFFNVYGPNEYHKGPMRSMVCKAFEAASAGEPVRLFRSGDPEVEDGHQKRDFVAVQDCVEVMLWLGDRPEVSGLFNVGSGRARAFLDLARAVFTALDREPEIDWVETPEEILRGYQYFTEADLTKLRKAGYDAPSTGLEEGVEHYVRTYLAAGDPYR